MFAIDILARLQHAPVEVEAEAVSAKEHHTHIAEIGCIRVLTYVRVLFFMSLCSRSSGFTSRPISILSEIVWTTSLTRQWADARREGRDLL
jgi:hypothetical protein